MPVEGMRLPGPVQSSIPPSPNLPPVSWLVWWDVFPRGHGPKLICSPRTHGGSPQAVSAESFCLPWIGKGDASSPAKRGHSPQRVAAPRCHGKVGPVPGQPDPRPGTGLLSPVLVSAQTTSPSLCLTRPLQSPQGEGCNQTARAGLEGHHPPSDRGKAKRRGPKAAEGGLGAWEL